MKLERLVTFFETSPAAKLLRSPHAPYVIYFLNMHFKTAANLTLLHSEIQRHLTAFLDQLHETTPEVMRERADAYLTQWSTGDNRWLARHYNTANAEPSYQLTPHSEDVLTFLTEVLERELGFVGTESRLKRIIHTLQDLVVHGSADPQRRLEYLRAEHQRIAREIQAIEASGVVPTHSPTAIRERFSEAVSDLISLQGDFRAVEESFKSITRTVQKQQTESSESRSDILGFALDAEDRLKSEDQGVSFHEFVRLVFSQSKQDELERLIAQLIEIPELLEQHEGMRRVQGMVSSLSAEAEKVLQTTRRLSATLRRLLDTRANSRHLRLARVLAEIRKLAVGLSDNLPDEGLEIDTELALSNSSQRTFWEAPLEFDSVPLELHRTCETERLAAFRDLARLRRLDWDTMKSRVHEVLRTRASTTLGELLEQFPPEDGTLEVLGYIQLAFDGGHEVSHEEQDVVFIDHVTGSEFAAGGGDSDEGCRCLEIPRVVFRATNSES
ncbi:MAG: DUF3375 family protein [Planctomycetales bacterium]|nr:DUF3375 family protein [Planctomycetales bacterium]